MSDQRSEALGVSIEIHGPMWQPECHRCDWMGDTYDSPEAAQRDADEHTANNLCLERASLRNVGGSWYAVLPGSTVVGDVTLREEHDEFGD